MEPNEVTHIVIHSSGTVPNEEDGFALVERLSLKRGALSIGYHFIIRTDGTVEEGRPLNRTGNHCVGWNDRSIGICLIGGLGDQGNPADTRTPEQRKALSTLLRLLKRKFTRARVRTHGQLHPRTSPGCPGFTWHDTKGAHDSSRNPRR